MNARSGRSNAVVTLHVNGAIPWACGAFIPPILATTHLLMKPHKWQETNYSNIKSNFNKSPTQAYGGKVCRPGETGRPT